MNIRDESEGLPDRGEWRIARVRFNRPSATVVCVLRPAAGFDRDVRRVFVRPVAGSRFREIGVLGGTLEVRDVVCCAGSPLVFVNAWDRARPTKVDGREASPHDWDGLYALQLPGGAARRLAPPRAKEGIRRVYVERLLDASAGGDELFGVIVREKELAPRYFRGERSFASLDAVSGETSDLGPALRV